MVEDRAGGRTVARRWGWIKQQFFIRSQLGATVRNLSGGDRVMPTYLCVGAQKAGTTFLHSVLMMHPEVMRPLYKELHFFNIWYSRGPRWYRSFFPVAPNDGLRHITGDATPDYMFHPLGAKRMAEVLPNAKLIVLIREPAARALSHYQMSVWLGHETLPFREAIVQEESRLAGQEAQLIADPGFRGRPFYRYSYKKRGMYLEQIQRLEQHFPKENILVIDSRQLFKQTSETLLKVEPFIGISEWTRDEYLPRNPAKVKEAVDEAFMAELREQFRPHNEALFQHLGIEPLW